MQNQISDVGSDKMYVMGLARSVSAVQLLTADAVKSDKRDLGIFLGWHDPLGLNKYYSLRSKENKPLVLLVVRDNAVIWCRGANAKRPKPYMSSVIEFIIRQRLGVAADMAGAGVVCKNGAYYNVYDLPKGFVYNGNMDLSYAGLVKLPDMSTVTIKGDYKISGTNLISLYGCPKIVTGNFYAYDNRPQKYTQQRPRNVIIGGRYYNVQPNLER